MKRVVATIVLAVLIIAAIVLWKSRDGAHAPDHAAIGSGSSVAAGSITPPVPKHEHTTRVTPEEHRRLAEQIAAAHAAHASHVAAPAAPKLPDKDSADDLGRLQEHVQAALKEAIPFLAACYEQHGSNAGMTASAQMTLTGDPDIGTVIDADQIYDDKHQPLPKQLDDCLRNTMQTLALPPLDTGDRVRIEYSFRFGDDDK